MGGYITFLFFWNHFLGVLFCLVCFFSFEHGSARWNFSRIGNTGYNISPPFSRLISKKWRQAAEDKQRSIGSGKIKSERNRRKMKYSFGFSFHLWQNKKKKKNNNNKNQTNKNSQIETTSWFKISSNRLMRNWLGAVPYRPKSEFLVENETKWTQTE